MGISIYLNKKVFNENWLIDANRHGFTSIFTSLHIPEDAQTTYNQLLYNLGSVAKANKMDLIADVSPGSLQYINADINNLNVLFDMGVTGLRLDYGFSTKEIVYLSKQLKIILNASTLNEQRLQELVDCGLNTENVEAAHNFYPRPETGLSRKYLIKKNKLFKNHHIKIAAFVPGDGERRQPLYEGLPTLEEHRYISPIKAYLDLKMNCMVSSVYVGDLSLKQETLSMFNYLKDDVIPLRYDGKVDNYVYGELYRYLENIHSNRMDCAQQVIRVAQSRIDLRNEKERIVSENTVYRLKGSITIDNYKYGRYAGEIQINCCDLKADPKVNVIGQIIPEDLALLEYIGGGQKFVLQKVD